MSEAVPIRAVPAWRADRRGRSDRSHDRRGRGRPSQRDRRHAHAGRGAVQSRTLHFADRNDGAVEVTDADRHIVAVLPPGTNGFARGVMRGLARARKLEDVGQEPPFVLTRWADGRLSLDDPSTHSTSIWRRSERPIQPCSRGF